MRSLLVPGLLAAFVLVSCGGKPAENEQAARGAEGPARVERTTPTTPPGLARPGDAHARTKSDEWTEPLTDESVQAYLESMDKLFDESLELVRDPKRLREYMDVKSTLRQKYGLDQQSAIAVETRLTEAMRMVSKPGKTGIPQHLRADCDMASKYMDDLNRLRDRQRELVDVLKSYR